MKKILGTMITAAVLAVAGQMAAQAQTVFSDNFNTSQGATFTTGGDIGTSPWTVTRSGADWGARIDNNILELTNTASAATNATGWVYASADTADFTAPWSSILSANTGLVTWDFNMRQIRTDPAGFGGTSYGVAFILGSTSTTVATAGNGYAVVLGNTTATDPVRLVSFTGGIQTLGTTTGGLITAASPLNDVGNSYLSLRVTYDPLTSGWEMFGRNDGATAFADPSVGPLDSLGTVTNSTYTGVSLTSMGAYWNGSTAATQTAFFDNVSVAVGAAPPASGLYWHSGIGWTTTSPGTGGSGTWDGGGGWDPAETAFFGDTGGTVTIDAGGVTANNGLSFEVDGYTVSGGTLTFGATSNVISVAAASDATINAVIAGSNGLTKTLPGTLALGGANTFTGGVTVSGGTLVIGADSALGNTANGLVVNGTLETTATFAIGAGRSVSGASTLDIAPGTTLTIEGPASFSATTLANSGTLVLNDATTRSVGNLTINSPMELQASGPISATGLTASGLSAGTATIVPAIVLTTGDKTVNVPGTGTLVLQGDVSGLGTSRLAKTGTGTLEIDGELTGGIRVGVAGTTDGGTVVLGQAASAGTLAQIHFNYGTLRTDAVGGLALTPGLSIGGRNATRAVLGAGEALSFAGDISFFGGSEDYVVEVNNSSTFSGPVALSTFGWTIRGSGDLTLSGDSSIGLTSAVTLADTLALTLDGLIGGDLIVGGGNVIGGGGTIGGNLTFLDGAGMVFDPLQTLMVNGASVSFENFGVADLVGFSAAVPDGFYTLIDGTATVDTTNLLNFGSANAVDLGGGRSAYFTTGSLNLVVVPEPSSFLLVGFGGLVVAGGVIRRRLR